MGGINLNNFYLNERALKDCLEHKFTFKNITEEEIFRCFYDSDNFLENIKLKGNSYKNLDIIFGPELHYGTMPFRASGIIRERASCIRDVMKPKRKHVFGEGLIRMVYRNNNSKLGYISFSIYNDSAFLGNIQTRVTPNQANIISKKFLKRKPIINTMFYGFKEILIGYNISKILCPSSSNKLGWRHDPPGEYWKGTCYDTLFKNLGGKLTENERWSFDL